MLLLVNKYSGDPIMFRYDGGEYPVGSLDDDNLLRGYVAGELAIPDSFYDPFTGQTPRYWDLSIADKDQRHETDIETAIHSTEVIDPIDDVVRDLRNRFSDVIDVVKQAIATSGIERITDLLDGLVKTDVPSEEPEPVLPTRVTVDRLDAVIAAETFYVHGTLTICVLDLENGFTVTGEAACVDPEKFDPLLGQTLARARAREKIWPLEGYLLRQRHHDTGL